MKKVLIKYKNIRLLINESASELFIKNIENIEKLQILVDAFYKNILNSSHDASVEIDLLKTQLSEFVEQSGVIGTPFDSRDAYLYALDRKLDFEILELHGNVGKKNAKKEDVKTSSVQIRIEDEMKEKWNEKSKREGFKNLTEFIIHRCELDK